MNNNRSYDYEKYVNSYGVRELFREAREARRLSDSAAGSSSGAGNALRIVLRLAPVAVVVAVLIHLLG